jgi:phytoene dehydrogenase-like protein
MYGPYLTMAEIKAKYPNALVLLANPTTTRGSLAPTGGYVILHAPDREEFNRLFDAWDDPEVKHLASWYTGEIKGAEILPPDAAPEPGAA